MTDLEGIYKEFREYLDRPWSTEKPSVAYFSMEFGYPSVPERSTPRSRNTGRRLPERGQRLKRPDYGCRTTYRFGYFKQKLDPKGTADNYEAGIFENTHKWLRMTRKTFDCQYCVARRERKGQSLEAKIGKVSLFLLDTDFEIIHPKTAP